MIDISAPLAMVGWFFDHLVKIVPEVVGGFVAYCLHLAYHEVWKKPGHWLTRRLRRSRPK